MAEVKVQKIHYGGWDNCVQITNGIVDLIVTADVGPRIIRYGFVGQENEMCEVGSTLGLKGGDEWRIYGGHRLWHSPEDKTRTYEPDNSPVAWEEIPDGVLISQSIEPATRIKKEMEIRLSPGGTNVRILHRLTNAGLWPVELSVWSISAMSTGGKEVIPQTSTNTGLLPNRIIALWPYTDLNDPRVILGNKYIVIRQDPEIQQPIKIGTSNETGWAVYFNHNHLFIKYYSHQNNARYPDFGVSYETYANDFMLEMETLSPLAKLGPNSSVEHTEKWELFDNVPMPPDDEDEIDRMLTQKMR
ncbi:MAG: hypothetical protein HY757_10400 [Nitrospirae bacterium]|nr:hypothetical protein [Nitrospirota bacterium]